MSVLYYNRGSGMHPPPLLIPHGLLHTPPPCHTLLILPRKRSCAKQPLFIVRASNQQPPPPPPPPALPSSVDSNDQRLSSTPVGGLLQLLSIPRSIWKQLLTPLNNFGFGQRSIWEGGVGIFIISGAILFSLTVAWLKGYQLRSRCQRYHAVIEFTKANGICVWTPVRMRGVDIGNVVTVRPSLESIDVMVQVSSFYMLLNSCPQYLLLLIPMN